jgi:hypothetical protein
VAAPPTVTSHQRWRGAIAYIAGLAIVTALLAPAHALADGDPASDELIGANVFYPFSPQVDAGLQKTLNSEAAAASRAHFPIKVALIESPADLGAIPSLFAKPQQYADFLDQEISFLNIKQLLLVVMPNGYGVQGLGQAATTAAGSLSKPRSGQSDDLARAAIMAVPKLAAAAGHPVGAISSVSGTGGPSSTLTLSVLAAAAIASAAAVLTIRNRRATTTARPGFTPRDSRRMVAKPRLLIAATLIAGGLGWAIARGLTFYGLTLPTIGYDLDQPPLLLVLAGSWLLYRSRRR